MSTSQTIWRRRIALMFAVAFVVGVPITLLVRGDDEAGEDGSGRSGAPKLAKPKTSDALRVGFRLPKKGWTSEVENDTLELRPKDRSALILIGAPAPSGERERVLSDLLAEIRSQYRAVEVRPAGGKVAKLDAKGAAVSATSKRGGKVEIVLATVNGRKRTYVVELFLSDRARPARVAEARAVLASLRLRG